MARSITTLLRRQASGSGGVTVPAGTAVGKLRIIQVHFANDSSTAQTFYLDVSGQYGTAQPIIPTLTLAGKTSKTYNLSIPLSPADGVGVTMSDAACNVVVVVEETD